ncbi:hypothetical protein PBCVCVR1_309R [Paramecium bursaria Chlorella virus CVR-1]|uniref:Uncharacterized protein n=1 Tax=Paramecium bursaria Chlorella virus CVA-1 TaxID=42683 RepID=M1HF64_9PHYC|nr:hypothetical protein F8205_gp102 [Paramecium bursaria Chlorella virus CVA-1]AGE50457.1 hypothetical protein PBCVCVA1_301R [Paramecium bursaria Chlorella virus CVA-1]AGE52137.1 hypothetical protein PBCVCVR1_309R [Paramecium bursaria Chlorella virus CVR-1]
MKKRYIASIIIAAILALAAVVFLVYKNWSDVQSIWFFTKTKIKNIKIPSINPVKPVDPVVIIEASKPDAGLEKERNALAAKAVSISNDAGKINQQAVNVVATEATAKAARAAPVSEIVVENTKQREVKNQSNASKAYTDLIKKIEIEKAKSAVLLTAIRTEKEKIAKINDLDLETEETTVDAMDMEMELFLENRLRNWRARRPLSKKGAEYLVRNLCI